VAPHETRLRKTVSKSYVTMAGEQRGTVRNVEAYLGRYVLNRVRGTFCRRRSSSKLKLKLKQSRCRSKLRDRPTFVV
jgi:hypothetical protein